MNQRVAVIGSGIAGLAAAHELGRRAEVTLYEADERLGGHADTHDVGGLAIDTGFIVHNRRTYPHLTRIFAELEVETQASEMSLSVRDDSSALEYAGSLGVGGLFPVRANLRNPAYLRMLTEIPRFHRAARKLLASDTTDETLRDFLRRGGFTTYFRDHFMAPLVASVWSCNPAVALDYPARYLFSFLTHHGMLQVFGSPQWRTVTGGSREYVNRIATGIHDIRLSTKVTSLAELPDGVQITDGNGGSERYAAAVVAIHPDQAISLLTDPTDAQREILTAIDYTANVALLHTDTSLMPRAPQAWASWNHLARPGHDDVTVTYDMTRLQRLPTQVHYLVTLGGEDLVDPTHVIARREYAHPLYTPRSVAARERQRELDTDRLHFAGAWQGWGFHEDGARSGVEAARRTVATFERPRPRPRNEQAAPAIYRTTVQHARTTPWTRAFSLRSQTWLVDLDALPDHGLLGRFEPRDHLGEADASLRSNVDNFLVRQGIHLDGGRVLMAAQPRAFGFCFNPISVFWCFENSGTLAGVVVEVHNTYGDRHAYLVHPDEHGNASTDKAMYVSPFNGTDGRYRIRVPQPGRSLLIAVALQADDGSTFSASLTGRRTPANRRNIWRAAPATLRGAVLIRLHGIALWLRRLPVRPRPIHSTQEGVS